MSSVIDDFLVGVECAENEKIVVGDCTEDGGQEAESVIPVCLGPWKRGRWGSK
jgi:hypothetical protein